MHSGNEVHSLLSLSPCLRLPAPRKEWNCYSTLDFITCRGFGFIKFVDPQSVDKVLGSPTHVIDEKKVE